MKTREINMSPLLFIHDLLVGDQVTKNSRILADLKGVFQDEQSYEAMDSKTLLYEVYSYLPVADGATGTDGVAGATGTTGLAGALNFGITHLYPGKVGQEYFMTKGHFHAQDDRAEYYWGIEGEGVLILMDHQRNIWGEKVFPGSLHYIPGGIAHRVANTGHKVLSFGACWPSDAGHNYEDIARNGFSARLMEVEGTPQLL